MMMEINGEPKHASLKHRLTLVLAIVWLFAIGASLSARAEPAPLLAAASSLRSLWPDLIERYQNTSTLSAIQSNEVPTPRASFASSGLLSTQIINGAPFELFLSADLESIERLPKNLLGAQPQRFALGELLLVAPTGSPLTQNLSMQSLVSAFSQAAESSSNTDASLKLAIPNPQHAPYGRAAREALTAANLWPLPPAQILVAENAAQTLQFVNTGAVAAALIPKALMSSVSADLVIATVPASSYQAVQHTVVLLNNASPAAKNFYTWLLSDRSSAPLLAAGLNLPER